MEPITIALKALKEQLNRVIISPGIRQVDLNDYLEFDKMEDLLQFTTMSKDPDIVEINDFVLNHTDYIGLYSNSFEEEFESVKREFNENLNYVSGNILSTYLNHILAYYHQLESGIKEDEKGKLYASFVTFEDCTAEEVNGSFNKDSYNNFLVGLKKRLRKEILFYERIEKGLPRVNSGSKDPGLSHPNMNEMVNQVGYTSPVNISGFIWSAKRSLEKDMILLYGLLSEHGIIPKNTDIKDIRQAFSGKPLQKLLKIRWQVKGKNQQTSKSSLFHFISRLEDFRLIETREWQSKDNSELYKKLAMIFADSNGEIFTIDGLSSSRSQGLGTRCAMEDEIDRIVKQVAESDSLSNSIPK
ncbi:MAG: hypothetical protein AB9888_04685 [Bacteroidales bacterium]